MGPTRRHVHFLLPLAFFCFVNIQMKVDKLVGIRDSRPLCRFPDILPTLGIDNPTYFSPLNRSYVRNGLIVGGR